MSGLQAVKARLKAFTPIGKFNARLKAGQIKREYARTVRHYEQRSPVGSLEELLHQRAGDRLQRLRGRQNRLNLLFLGTDELQDRSGILQALERLAQVAYFTKEDGTYGQVPTNGRPFLTRRSTNSDRLLALCRTLAGQGRTPDVLLGQMWGALIDRKALARVREQYGSLIVNICMDDRHAYLRGRSIGTHALIPHIDLAATAAPECEDWYLKEGCPAVFLPEASDPAIFRPMPELPKVHDVTFIGGRYGIRDTLVRSLRDAGVKVTAYGQGWEGGRLPTEEVPRVLAQSRIILGAGTVGYCEDFYALKLRDFDAPMSGSFYLTHANPDLERLYRLGEEIETFRSIEECVRKCMWFLERTEEREAIAQRGRARALAEHTWEGRFRGLLDRCLA
jgi:hypothetical protein